MNALHCATTGELLDELERRSVGLLLIAVHIEELGLKRHPSDRDEQASDRPDWAGHDTWWSKCRGSPMLVLAMQNFLKEIVDEYVRALETQE